MVSVLPEGRDRQHLALDCLQHGLAAAVLHLHGEVLRGHLAGHDMVGEHAGQLGLVLGLQQGVDRAGGQLGEGCVGGREDRERALALQGLDEAGGLHGGHQRRVVLRIDGVLDDGLRRDTSARRPPSWSAPGRSRAMTSRGREPQRRKRRSCRRCECSWNWIPEWVAWVSGLVAGNRRVNLQGGYPASTRLDAGSRKNISQAVKAVGPFM